MDIGFFMRLWKIKEDGSDFVVGYPYQNPVVWTEVGEQTQNLSHNTPSGEAGSGYIAMIPIDSSDGRMV